jgi:hypothetical protein
VWSAGSITLAVAKARRAAGFSTKIEVEARTLEEGLEAASAGADIVMLDNFEPDALKAAARKLKAAHPHVLIEASGGITVENLTQFASADVDIISKSYHQGYDVLDFSLKIIPATPGGKLSDAELLKLSVAERAAYERKHVKLGGGGIAFDPSEVAEDGGDASLDDFLAAL